MARLRVRKLTSVSWSRWSTRRARGTAGSVARRGLDPRRVRLDGAARRGPSGAAPTSCRPPSSPAAQRARNAEPSAAPSGTAVQLDREAGAVGERLHPLVDPGAARRSRRSGAASMPCAALAASIVRRATNPDASNAARRSAAASWVRSRSASTPGGRGRASGRAHRAGTAPTPGRGPGSAARPARRRRSGAVAQFTKSPPALLGPPARNLPRRGVRDHPVARQPAPGSA